MVHKCYQLSDCIVGPFLAQSTNNAENYPLSKNRNKLINQILFCLMVKMFCVKCQKISVEYVVIFLILQQAR